MSTYFLTSLLKVGITEVQMEESLHVGGLSRNNLRVAVADPETPYRGTLLL